MEMRITLMTQGGIQRPSVDGNPESSNSGVCMPERGMLRAIAHDLAPSRHRFPSLGAPAGSARNIGGSGEPARSASLIQGARPRRSRRPQPHVRVEFFVFCIGAAGIRARRPCIHGPEHLSCVAFRSTTRSGITKRCLKPMSRLQNGDRQLSWPSGTTVNWPWGQTDR